MVFKSSVRDTAAPWDLEYGKLSGGTVQSVFLKCVSKVESIYSNVDTGTSSTYFRRPRIGRINTVPFHRLAGCLLEACVFFLFPFSVSVIYFFNGQNYFPVFFYGQAHLACHYVRNLNKPKERQYD
jgi:hypothetical protein